MRSACTRNASNETHLKACAARTSVVEIEVALGTPIQARFEKILSEVVNFVYSFILVATLDRLAPRRSQDRASILSQ